MVPGLCRLFVCLFARSFVVCMCTLVVALLADNGCPRRCILMRTARCCFDLEQHYVFVLGYIPTMVIRTLLLVCVSLGSCSGSSWGRFIVSGLCRVACVIRTRNALGVSTTSIVFRVLVFSTCSFACGAHQHHWRRLGEWMLCVLWFDVCLGYSFTCFLGAAQ